MSRLPKKEIVISLLVVIFFIITSYFSYIYSSDLENIRSFQGASGRSLYVFITAVAVVAAPISTLPLLPIAASLWGSFTAAILSIIGWSVGGAAAFLLARWGGQIFVEKFVSLKKLNQISSKVPKTNLFVSVIFLRLAVPVDILSYSLGLFTSMKFWPYILATIIGVTPFAFIFSYSVKLPISLQLIGGFLAVIIFGFGYIKAYSKTKKGF